MNIIGQIIKKCFKKEHFNILTSPIHERFQSNWKDLLHNFWLIHVPNGKTWDSSYAKLPRNHILIDKNHFLPNDVEIDLIISQNKFDAFSYFYPIAKQFKIPLISIEHTAPVPTWPKEQVEYMKNMKGDVNVFITDWSREKWGWLPNECDVVYHGIDTNVFTPLVFINKKDYILSVVNDFRNRDWCCGFNVWKEVVNGLPWKHLGKDPGFSEPAKSIDDLVFHHNECAVFLNTSTVSPVPMSLMEAMASGTACVSTNTCDIPKIIKHGYNGLLGNSSQELRQHCITLLKNEKLRQTLGENARKTILEKFSLDKFTEKWNEIIIKAYDTRII